jgi:hypothetical protein
VIAMTPRRTPPSSESLGVAVVRAVEAMARPAGVWKNPQKCGVQTSTKPPISDRSTDVGKTGCISLRSEIL